MEYETNVFAAQASLSDEEALEYIDQGYDIGQIAKAMHSDINLVAMKADALIMQGYRLRHQEFFANADGCTLVIGIGDDVTFTGIDDYTEKVNDILRAPFDYCKPSVLVSAETVACIDKDGKTIICLS